MNTLTAVSLLLTLGACYSAVVQPVYSGDKFELLILHNNDMHAKFEQTSQRSGACTVQDREAGKCYGGFPRVAHVVKEARRKAQTGEGPPVLYLNAGDTYTGTAWFTIYKWRIAAEFINALQPDAVSLGNHEFDENIDGLIPFIRNVSTPVLASNLILNKVPELAKEENLKRSIVITVEGKKIAIIGYLTAETKFLAPKNEVEYIDEVDAIQAEVDKYKQEGVNIFIALGHSGFVKDLEIARKVIGLDLVIGGHSNTFLWNGETKEIPEIPDGHYPYEVKQASGKIVRVVQAYAYTKYMGLLRLSFNERGDIIECSGEPILLDNTVPQDPEVEQIVEKYKYKIDLVNNVIVGTSMVTLQREYCRVRECNIGSLITDAVLNYTQSENESYQANIAFVQGGRIRTSLDRPEKPFNMTRGDWLNVIPFDDPLTLVSVDGKTLKEALEHSVSNWRLIDSPGSFLQVSGMEVVYDLANPKGSRVVNARAMCSKCKTLEPVKNDDQYKILMSSFLADGGDGFAMFEGLDKEILNYNEIDCIINYLSKTGPIAQTEMGRITVKNENVITNDFLRSSQMVVLPSSLLSCIALLFLQYFI